MLLLLLFICIVPIISVPPYRSLVVRYDEPITFETLIMNIIQTARQSKDSKQSIYKMYKRVIFGQSEEMNTIEIGRLTIQFDPATSTIDILKYQDGYRYFKRQTAAIKWVNKIPNGLSGTQLMTFINALLSELPIRQASVYDVASKS